MQLMPVSWLRRLIRKAVLALSESRQTWSTRYGVIAGLLDHRTESGRCHWSSRVRYSKRKLRILEKSLKRRRAQVLSFVCARGHFHLGVELVLTVSSAMLDEVAWLYNLRGNEYGN